MAKSDELLTQLDLNWQVVDVVGPICETGDYIGLDRKLPSVRAGDLLYIRGCGAYAATMASNYNSRPRAPEVMVDRDQVKVISRRETLADLCARESGNKDV